MPNLQTLGRFAGLSLMLALFSLAATPADAGGALGTQVGVPFSSVLGVAAGPALPIAESGLLALLAGGVVGGVYLVRRKR